MSRRENMFSRRKGQAAGGGAFATVRRIRLAALAVIVVAIAAVVAYGSLVS
jgi:hypothetical protein